MVEAEVEFAAYRCNDCLFIWCGPMTSAPTILEDFCSKCRGTTLSIREPCESLNEAVAIFAREERETGG